MVAKRRKSVLVVDDDRVILDLVKDLIEDNFPSITVVQANDGHVGYNKVCVQKFDLLITDYKMPKLSGAKLIANLDMIPQRSRPDNIVIITGNQKEIQRENIDPSITMVEKPWEEEEFLELLKKLLIDKEEIKPKKKPGTMDTKAINPFIDATLRVLKTTCFTEAEKEEVYVRRQEEPAGDISALVAMNSSKFVGSMAVCFQKDCYLSIVGRMLGETYEELDEEIQDAIGELCNQIFGLTKLELNKQGNDIQPAIPSVVVGQNHTLRHMIPGVCLAVKFKTDVGTFVVEAIIAPNRN